MKLSSAVLASGLASLAVATPVTKRAALSDADILQFALTLEHLENTFYKQAIATLSPEAFFAEGYSQQFYNQLLYIAQDEQTHVVALEGALKAAGVTPVAACSYDFGITDARSFVTISNLLEGTGTSAYLGAAPAISNPDYLTVAGSILAVEALHTSQQRAYLGLIPFANAFMTPLDANSVFTLASSFITSCPSSNPALPFTAAPSLAAVTGTAPTFEGVPFAVTADGNVPSSVWATWVSGVSVISEKPVSVDGSSVVATVPSAVSGQAYLLLTSSKVSSLSDADILFGPAIVEVTPAAPSFDPSIL